MTTTALRTLAAEARAVEEGHLCRFDAARHLFLVRSDSSSRTHELTALGVGDRLVVTCTCPAGVKGSHVPAGSLRCKHAALVARRLARAGLVTWDAGIWRTTHLAASFVSALTACEVAA